MGGVFERNFGTLFPRIVGAITVAVAVDVVVVLNFFFDDILVDTAIGTGDGLVTATGWNGSVRKSFLLFRCDDVALVVVCGLRFWSWEDSGWRFIIIIIFSGLVDVTATASDDVVVVTGGVGRYCRRCLVSVFRSLGDNGCTVVVVVDVTVGAATSNDFIVFSVPITVSFLDDGFNGVDR
jgi:hypothetical protein